MASDTPGAPNDDPSTPETAAVSDDEPAVRNEPVASDTPAAVSDDEPAVRNEPVASDTPAVPVRPRYPIDLTVTHRIHVVGLGGVGMNAVASVLASMGQQVSGSDLKASAELERLAALGVEAHVGHDRSHLDGVEIVTISTAIPADNIEVVEAHRRGIPVVHRSDVLAAIAATRQSVAVAGTHGKTTTASMLALVLVEAGMRPSFVIGGEINEVGSGAAWGSGDWLVVEADESDGTFLALTPDIAVVTCVEPDHLDYYGSVAVMQEAYAQFLAAGRRALVCLDDPVAAALGGNVGAVTFGTAEGADYRMVELATAGGSTIFSVVHDDPALGPTSLGPVQLAVPGLYNARNACGALVAGLLVGATVDSARRALARFGGVARRFEFRGQRAGVTFVDDYAHLPSEAKAVLAAARDGGWQRIVAVFQPHRYSRTASLWRDFADAFVDADVVVVTDVYPAGESPRPGVSGRLVFDAVVAAHPETDGRYVSGHQELLAYLEATLRPGDLCLTLGAGDLTVVPDELLEDLA
jgi:UDP-N-acetylmuramate--alanine ligase